MLNRCLPMISSHDIGNPIQRSKGAVVHHWRFQPWLWNIREPSFQALLSVPGVSKLFTDFSTRVHRICRHVPAGRAAPCPAYDTMFGISQAARGRLEYSRYYWNTLATKSSSLIYLSSSQSGIGITNALGSWNIDCPKFTLPNKPLYM